MDLPPPPALPADASLFLDFDGTLVEIAERPDGVAVGPALHALLRDLAERLPGRVALVSGRSIAQLDQLLGVTAARLALAGSHGAERRNAAGVRHGEAAPDGLARIADRLAAFAQRDAGLVVERKALGVALHYRGSPDRESEAHCLAAALAEAESLTLQHGKMMVEVRAPGDKGEAVRRMLVEEPAMRGSRPLALGDDVTDEDMFVAAAVAGGAGVLVGDGRDTAARYRLGDVAAVHRWLAGGGAGA